MGKSHNIGKDVHGFEPQMRIMINEPNKKTHVKTTSGQRDTGAYHHIPELLEVFFLDRIWMFQILYLANNIYIDL